MYEEHGKLTAELVVEQATPKKHPLHVCFQWDDKKAGHEYRLIQARTMIREVRTLEVHGRLQTVHHVPVTPDPESKKRSGAYVASEVLIDDYDAYQRALDAALRDLDSAMRRVAELRALKRDEQPDSKFDLAIQTIETVKLALVA